MSNRAAPWTGLPGLHKQPPTTLQRNATQRLEPCGVVAVPMYLRAAELIKELWEELPKERFGMRARACRWARSADAVVDMGSGPRIK